MGFFKPTAVSREVPDRMGSVRIKPSFADAIAIKRIVFELSSFRLTDTY
ncbi:hypothetical protein MC7420_307 [Coleofasciculus chthonoplastes PCC 7420]|uniref:Uncharacterized protein n=1 Tax=Coleofasciculus chthonoplastes PCC 7420 TaxID=118168 RepID=B4VL39_9CYAN|nr:hypothetical protein MC7420_307 [Coleofasciculus chthonoplastes PCC 7420]